MLHGLFYFAKKRFITTAPCHPGDTSIRRIGVTAMKRMGSPPSLLHLRGCLRRQRIQSIPLMSVPLAEQRKCKGVLVVRTMGTCSWCVSVLLTRQQIQMSIPLTQKRIRERVWVVRSVCACSWQESVTSSNAETK